MNKTKRIGVPFIMLSALLLSSCGNSGYDTYPVTGPYMTNKTAKSVYNAYLGSAPTTLSPITSQSAENVTHIANVLDTLVMNDNYGILRKNLATKATHSADNKEFRFTIRTDVPWVTSSGEIYKYKNVEQYVKAEDFVTTAKEVLNYNNSSEIYYMYTLFINNAWEYYCYTMMTKFIQESKPGYTSLKGDYNAQAKKLTELIEEYSGHEPDEPISGSDITKIAKFERVGVKVDTTGELVYTLRTSASFFPTMLTYTPYCPTNKNFYKEAGSNYGKTTDKMIYCGAFYLTEFTSNSVKYQKNTKYYNADNVHISNVNYKVIDTSTTYAQMREAFDRDEVDGFSLDTKDETGWDMYIKGPKGTGTMQDPASDLVNSRELDDVSYTYHACLNINRSTDSASYANCTYWDKLGITSDEDKVKTIENTNAAMKIKEVRQLVLDGFDLSKYFERFTTEDQYQYAINTFTPRGYVYDQYGKDYVEFYYEEYAEQKGISVERAKELVKPQQVSGTNYVTSPAEDTPWLSITSLRENAIKAVEDYNSSYGTLSLPIIIDHFGIGGISTDDTVTEEKTIQDWNERANGCTLSSNRVKDGRPLCSTAESGHYPYFEMVNNTITNSSTWESASQNGYYTVSTSWGWVGDYADPLTYLHCYVKNGEMAKMTGNTDDFDNYSLQDGALVKDEGHMLDKYTALVNEASEITDSNQERYKKFAEAEYVLLNDLYIMKPLYMQSQGWAASVSRACGYENPNAAYGLADNSLVGIWVLVDVPTGKERKEARNKQATLKEQALEAVGRNTIESAFDA